MDTDENQMQEQTGQQAEQQESYDYSQPLFETKSVSIFSFLSAIIFIVAGVIWIIIKASRFPIEVGSVLLVVGIVLLVRNILAMLGISFGALFKRYG